MKQQLFVDIVYMCEKHREICNYLGAWSLQGAWLFEGCRHGISNGIAAADAQTRFFHSKIYFQSANSLLIAAKISEFQDHAERSNNSVLKALLLQDHVQSVATPASSRHCKTMRRAWHQQRLTDVTRRCAERAVATTASSRRYVQAKKCVQTASSRLQN